MSTLHLPQKRKREDTPSDLGADAAGPASPTGAGVEPAAAAIPATASADVAAAEQSSESAAGKGKNLQHKNKRAKGGRGDRGKGKGKGRGKPGNDELAAEAKGIRCVVDAARGLRMLDPYEFCFKSYAKKRWLNRELLEVFTSEFQSETPAHYEAAIKAGTITVNGKTVRTDRKLRDNDLILNTVHRHEPPVTDQPLVIVHQDADVVVVDKQASIPVHACGRYRHNTIVMMLGREHGLWGCLPCHRLDRLTSGVLILAKNTAAANRVQSEIRAHTVQKEYICRVRGLFPGPDAVVCEASIKVANHKLGVCCVDETDGKECKTTFRLLSAHGTYSLVKCLPETGRMHQIRVHLQHLGFPIENDPVYNLNVTEDGTPTAPSDWSVQRAIQQVTETLAARDAAMVAKEVKVAAAAASAASAASVGDGGGAEVEVNKGGTMVDGIDWRTTPFYSASCGECQLWRPYPKKADMLIYLHAYKYGCKLWEYQTAMPSWAS